MQRIDGTISIVSGPSSFFTWTVMSVTMQVDDKGSPVMTLALKDGRLSGNPMSKSSSGTITSPK